MKKIFSVFLIAAILGTLCMLVVLPVSADGEVTPEPTTTVTLDPVTAPTTEPTPEPTTAPTTATPVPTTEPTTVATTKATTAPTMVTPVPTTEPTITITIPTVEPTSVGGGKGYIDTYSNVDGAAVSFDGTYECTTARVSVLSLYRRAGRRFGR